MTYTLADGKEYQLVNTRTGTPINLDLNHPQRNKLVFREGVQVGKQLTIHAIHPPCEDNQYEGLLISYLERVQDSKKQSTGITSWVGYYPSVFNLELVLCENNNQNEQKDNQKNEEG